MALLFRGILLADWMGFLFLWRGHRLVTIPGRVPELIDLPAGCGFADRCALAIDACRRAAPPEIELTPGHAARCIRLGDVANLP